MEINVKLMSIDVLKKKILGFIFSKEKENGGIIWLFDFFFLILQKILIITVKPQSEATVKPMKVELRDLNK